MDEKTILINKNSEKKNTNRAIDTCPERQQVKDQNGKVGKVFDKAIF